MDIEVPIGDINNKQTTAPTTNMVGQGASTGPDRQMGKTEDKVPSQEMEHAFTVEILVISKVNAEYAKDIWKITMSDKTQTNSTPKIGGVTPRPKIQIFEETEW